MSAQRFAIVGFGSIGRRHFANLRRLRPEAKIAVCRLSGKTNRLPDDAPTPDAVFHNIQEVVDFAPTAAVISTPASKHLEPAVALAQSGVHLLIEKPLASTYAAASQLNSVLDSSGIVALVGYNLRYLSSLSIIRRKLDERACGRVLYARAEVGQYLPDWRPATDYRTSVSAKAELGGGTLLELSHEIDYVTWLLGLPNRVSAVSGNYSSLEIDVEDLSELVFHYDKPAMMVSIHLDFLDRAAHRTLRVVGEQATLHWDAIGDRVEMFDPVSKSWFSLHAESCQDRNLMYAREMDDFLECVDRCQPRPLDLGHATEVVRIVEACRQAAGSGNVVELTRPACNAN